MVTLIYRILSVSFALFGLWCLVGTYGWNLRETERFESEMESQGHSAEPDELSYLPSVAIFAMAVFFWLVAMSS